MIEIKGASIYALELPLPKNEVDQLQNWLSAEQQSYGEKRKQDFLAGRLCAKRALSKLGIEVDVIAMDSNRAPLWPLGITGSITHTQTWALAAVSKSLQALGLDAEVLMSKERYEKLEKMIVNTDEKKLIHSNLTLFPTLVFSAKESLYKALYPHCLEYFGFLEASMREINDKKFVLELKSKNPKVCYYNGLFEGEYHLQDNTLITWIALDEVNKIK